MTTETTRTTRSPHLRTGERGEALAARYLESQGLTVLTRNWRCREGELDLVLTDGRQLVVCEVKTRTSTTYGPPSEAVDDAKAARIRRLARRWRTAHGVPHVDVRFDIVSVLWPPGEKPEVNHLKGVL
jgi:putative endonuclease